MSRSLTDHLVDDGVYYPDSDGEPMADNEPQLAVILRLIVGFRSFYADQPDVHVTGDVFWYPVKGHPEIVRAPDVMVIFGLSKDQLYSYRPFTHGGHVVLVIEVRSPNNSDADMADKLAFSDRHGAQEYLTFDPETGHMAAYERRSSRLVPTDPSHGWTSPATGVHFTVDDRELITTDPTSHRWLDPEHERLRADQERLRADQEHLRAEQAERRVAQLAAELDRLRQPPGETTSLD